MQHEAAALLAPAPLATTAPPAVSSRAASMNIDVVGVGLRDAAAAEAGQARSVRCSTYAGGKWR